MQIPTRDSSFPVMVKVRAPGPNGKRSQEVILLSTKDSFQSFCSRLQDSKRSFRRSPNIDIDWTHERIDRIVVQWESTRFLDETTLHDGNMLGALTLIKARGGLDAIRVFLKEGSPEVKKRR